MENHIKNLKIQNFKSLKDIEMNCSRINLIVGKPNVGKSNILEALSLFCFSYSTELNHFFSEFIRYNEISELFFDQDIENDIKIDIENIFFRGQVQPNQNYFKFKYSNYPEWIDGGLDFTNSDDSFWSRVIEIGNDGKLKGAFNKNELGIKKYVFREVINFKQNPEFYLKPPFGNNLFNVIVNRKELREEIAEWFAEYNLDLVLDKRTKTISAQKRDGNIVYPISYKLLADTLKRMIFHHAAVKSNKDSIILFEEPENHSFPPYVYQLAQNIINDENNNQFFITTHSPHLFNTIVENTPIEEQSIFIANYKDYQTEIKKLSKEELSELLDFGIDIFFNQKYFLDNE